MERESEEEKDYWYWANETFEAHCEKVQKRVSDRGTKGSEGTEDRVDARRRLRNVLGSDKRLIGGYGHRRAHEGCVRSKRIMAT